jgi:tetratricopeptide (TPR) repeat protein
MRYRIALAAAVLAVLAAGCGPIEKRVCSLPKPDAKALAERLVERRFAELEHALRAYQDATEADPACEGRTWAAFAAAAVGPGRADRLADLDAFAEAFPESFVPFAVRGRWRQQLAFQKRGSRYASDTTSGRRVVMRDELQRALPDLERAIELRPGASVAHADVLRIARTVGDAGAVYEIYERGVAACPRSHLLRATMIPARSPRQGGSRAEQARLAFDAWTQRAENPRMWHAVGSLFISLGDDLWWRNHWVATQMYSIALRCDDAVAWYERRAKAYYKDGDGDGAIADARAILDQEPRNEFAWQTIVGTYQKRNDWAGAVGEVDRVLALSPDDTELLVHRAYSNSKGRNWEAAEADYDRIIALDRSSRFLQAYSRYFVEEKGRDFERAVALMREAIAADPLNADNWSHLAGAQYRLQDPAMRESYQRFVDLVDTSIPENAERKRAIQAFLDSGGGVRDRRGRIPPEEAARLRDAAAR